MFVGFYLWPAIQTVIWSFFEWGLLRPWSATDPDTWEFVGLENYTTVLADGSFWNAAVNTVIWLVLPPAAGGRVLARSGDVDLVHRARRLGRSGACSSSR